jgi:pseudomonalisin
MQRQAGTRAIVATFLLIFGCCVAARAQAPANRVSTRIDEARMTTLLGNVHSRARPEFDRGMVSAEMRLPHMVLQLEPSPAQQKALDALVEAQHNPRSLLYHRWLTPAEYGARFGVSQRDLLRITAWLTRRGFTVDEVPVNHRQIIFSGNAGQVDDTFHTQIHHYLVGSVSHIANSQDPQIPSALIGVVGGIVSLHDFRSVSQIQSRKALSVRPRNTAGTSHYLFPADWATIYDVNPLYESGITGAGTSIAIVGRSNINLADVAEFRQSSGLAANTPSVILVSTDPGLVAGDQDESTLDVEWSGAVAPAAAVKFVVGASTATTDGIDLSAQYVVNHVMAPVMSTSYGSCEADLGSTEMSFYNSLWQQAASEGISSFVSSGDSGAAGCYGDSSSAGLGTGVNGLCSSPYATCVGGTAFNEGSASSTYWSSRNGAGGGSALSYIPEEVWNESGSNGGSGFSASGGGASLYFSQPVWQKEISGISAAEGMRAVPDVAVSAAGHDGYIIVEDGNYFIISGTSAASPSFAGLMALVVESAGGLGQGNANPALYALLNASRNPFHATPSGSNSVPGVTGFTASAAPYNLATGLGSVDGTILAGVWGGESKSTIDFAVTPSATAGTVVAGKTATFTLSVIESGSANNRVSFTATWPAGVTGSITPASILPGALATVTVVTTAAMAAGIESIVINASDSTGTQTATYTLTVTAPSTLTLNAASTSTAVVQGGSATIGFRAVTGGSFAGSLSYSLAGLPAGITANWSNNPATATVGTNSEMLTLTASSTATAGSATVVVTVTGDGLTASKSIPILVQTATRTTGFVLIVSPQSIVVPPDAMATVTLTAIPVGGAVVQPGGIGSTMNLTAGAPSGFTVSSSVPAETADGAVVWTLTLTGSATAGTGRSVLKFDATLLGQDGSVYQTSINVPITVTLDPFKRVNPRPVSAIGQPQR